MAGLEVVADALEERDGGEERDEWGAGDYAEHNEAEC